MMPILHSPGLMMPGQFGPINRVALCVLSALLTWNDGTSGEPRGAGREAEVK
jgi:hypothetical protein